MDDRINIESAHPSVVIFTEDPYAADRCIKFGVFIAVFAIKQNDTTTATGLSRG